MRVAQDHTYFVGGNDWGFSVWVHNTYTKVRIKGTDLFFLKKADSSYVTIKGKKTAFTAEGANKVIANALKGPIAGWTQSAPDSQLLARALGIQRRSGFDAHHIVTGTHRRGGAARQLLDYYQIDINDAANGVAIVGGRGASKNILPRRHRGGGLHSFRGIDEVNDRLAQAVDGVSDWATGRQRILDELAAIRQEILNGTFPN